MSSSAAVKGAQIGSSAADAAAILHEREADLSQQTEDVARLAARHQSAHRFLADARKTLDRHERAADGAREALSSARETLEEATETVSEARARAEEAEAMAERAEALLNDADEARAEAQSREAEARAGRSEAEGEFNALRAEVTALSRLLERDTAEGGQILDRLQVEQGFEKALGAALADDLRAPEVEADGPTGWTVLPEYDATQPLPQGVTETHVSLFDGSNCGLAVDGKPIFSVQHHPEASPGPQDSHYLFKRFFNLIREKRGEDALAER